MKAGTCISVKKNVPILFEWKVKLKKQFYQDVNVMKLSKARYHFCVLYHIFFKSTPTLSICRLFLKSFNSREPKFAKNCVANLARIACLWNLNYVKMHCGKVSDILFGFCMKIIVHVIVWYYSNFWQSEIIRHFKPYWFFQIM